MYKFLIFALMIFAASATAQPVQPIGTQLNQIWVRGSLFADSSIRAFTPRPDTFFTSNVAPANKQGTAQLVNNIPYVYTTKWERLTTGTGYLPISDTAAMLLPYLRKADTTAMLLPYMRKVDTTAMLAPYLKEVDTTAMLLPYAHKDGSNASGTWPIGISGNAATATKWATGRTLSITGDLAYTSPALDGTGNVTAAGTLATVNSGGGTVGSSTSIPSITYNAKGLVTASSGNAVIAPAGTLTGTTLNSTVVTSSLTSVGTLGSLTVTTPITGSVTGNAGTVTTNANLTGPIASVGNATSITSQTGTGTTFAMAAGPTLTNPILGNATATSLNTGTTLNGTIFAKSTNNISNVSNNHALTVGGEATGLNMALGTYSTGVGIQARNNGNNAAFYLCPIGGSDVHVGSSFAGTQSFYLNNTDAGSTSFATFKVTNGATANDAVSLLCLSSGFTPSGGNLADGASLAAETGLSGGLSIIVKNSAATFRVYTNNTNKRLEIDQNGDAVFSNSVTSTGGKLGYSTGAGGTVTQGTSRTTGVTLNKLSGTITMFSAAQASQAIVTFTLTNSFIAATDYLAVQHISATDGGAWQFSTVCGAGSATITVRNVSAGSITSATPLQFILFKAVNN